MSRKALVPPELAKGPFRGSQAIAAGDITWAQLRGPTWRRLHHDVYALAAGREDPGTRAEAAALLLPKGAAITGRVAAWIWGARLATVTDCVEVISPVRRQLDGR